MTVCIVDPPSSGFQCASAENDPGYFLKLSDGEFLKCSSSQDTEIYLKQCVQNHKITKMTLCSYEAPSDLFRCMKPDETLISKEILEMDNWVCLSPKDRRRMDEACEKGQLPSPSEILERFKRWSS